MNQRRLTSLHDHSGMAYLAFTAWSISDEASYLNDGGTIRPDQA